MKLELNNLYLDYSLDYDDDKTQYFTEFTYDGNGIIIHFECEHYYSCIETRSQDWESPAEYNIVREVVGIEIQELFDADGNDLTLPKSEIKEIENQLIELCDEFLAQHGF